jgi:hypothetical protein
MAPRARSGDLILQHRAPPHPLGSALPQHVQPELAETRGCHRGKRRQRQQGTARASPRRWTCAYPTSGSELAGGARHL